MSPPDARREERRRHLAGFLAAGTIAFLVDAGLLTLLTAAFALAPELARVPSFLAAVATTWVLNRRYTFRTRQPPTVGEFLRYLSAMMLGLAINYAVFLIVLRMSATAEEIPALALVPATLCGMAANFLTSRRILHR